MSKLSTPCFLIVFIFTAAYRLVSNLLLIAMFRLVSELILNVFCAVITRNILFVIFAAMILGGVGSPSGAILAAVVLTIAVTYAVGAARAWRRLANQRDARRPVL